MYCPPTVKKWVLISLSSFASEGALEVPCRFLFWLRKSYSIKAIPPSWVGNIALVPTSNTPHPQAHAQPSAGAKIIIAMMLAEHIMNRFLSGKDKIEGIVFPLLKEHLNRDAFKHLYRH
jgi:hypothetical protein